jgi:hypothetical protein
MFSAKLFTTSFIHNRLNFNSQFLSFSAPFFLIGRQR